MQWKTERQMYTELKINGKIFYNNNALWQQQKLQSKKGWKFECLLMQIQNKYGSRIYKINFRCSFFNHIVWSWRSWVMVRYFISIHGESAVQVKQIHFFTSAVVFKVLVCVCMGKVVLSHAQHVKELLVSCLYVPLCDCVCVSDLLTQGCIIH